jgi:hypothetical protein
VFDRDSAGGRGTASPTMAALPNIFVNRLDQSIFKYYFHGL